MGIECIYARDRQNHSVSGRLSGKSVSGWSILIDFPRIRQDGACSRSLCQPLPRRCPVKLFTPPRMLRHVGISKSSSGLVWRTYGPLRSYHDESFGFRKPRTFTHADCESLWNFRSDIRTREWLLTPLIHKTARNSYKTASKMLRCCNTSRRFGPLVMWLQR